MNAPVDRSRLHGVIGIFDSGVGGLSVLRAIWRELPDASTIYVADSIHCPYGERSIREIIALSEGISRFLIDRGAEAIVVACNTASAAALSVLRQHDPKIPFVGMVPAVKPAARLTRTGVVGVLATPNTFGGQLYHDVVEHHASGVRVVSRVCEGLVQCVERGDLESAGTERLLRACVEPLLAAGADTLVLGCTHYPFLMPTLQRLFGEDVRLVEPSQAVARQAHRVLAGRKSAHMASDDRDETVTRTFYTTGDPTECAVQIENLLGMRAEVSGLYWKTGRLAKDDHELGR